MRVAHLTTVDMSLALLLGTELRMDVEAGLEVYGISAPGEYVPGIEELGVRHVAVPALTRAWHPGKDVVAARETAAALRRLSLDVLHTHTPKAGVIGRVLGRLLRVPVVVNTCHGLWLREDDSRLGRAAVLALEGMAAAVSHAELYQNAEDRERLRWAVPRRRSQLVGNGVDLEVFRRDQAARERVRAALAVPPDRLLVGGVGRRVVEKGIGEFAQAARALADRAEFVWVGPPDEVDPLPDTAAQGLRLVGPRHDMPAVYNALDVFVLPSYREGFSRSAMEAAAVGLPMVLTDIRGCREIGESERHLVLVPPRDPRALTRAISRLLEDGPFRSSLARAAHQRASEMFDQRRVALDSLRTYHQVASRAGLGWQVDDSGGAFR